MTSMHARLRALVRALTAALAATTTAATLAAGSLVGAGDTPDNSTKDVVLVTHGSFVLPKSLVRQFEQQSGYDLVVHAAGDGGTLTNKLVLTQSNPTGDV